MSDLKRELVVNYESVDNKQGCLYSLGCLILLGKTCGVSFPEFEQLSISKGCLIENVELKAVVSFEFMGHDTD